MSAARAWEWLDAPAPRAPPQPQIAGAGSGGSLVIPRAASSRRARSSRAHGASNVRVTGSVARGEARDGSDIDLIVDLAPGRSVRDLSELILDLQDALGCRVEGFELRQLRPQLPGRRHLESIAESLAHISEYVAGGREVFFSDWMVHDAVAQRLADVAGADLLRYEPVIAPPSSPPHYLQRVERENARELRRIERIRRRATEVGSNVVRRGVSG